MAGSNRPGRNILINDQVSFARMADKADEVKHLCDSARSLTVMLAEGLTSAMNFGYWSEDAARIRALRSQAAEQLRQAAAKLEVIHAGVNGL
jgi:hypothetical protein